MHATAKEVKQCPGTHIAMLVKFIILIWAFGVIQLVQWEFADNTLSTPGDQFSDTTKLRKAGFEGQVAPIMAPSLTVCYNFASAVWRPLGVCHRVHAHVTVTILIPCAPSMLQNL